MRAFRFPVASIVAVTVAFLAIGCGREAVPLKGATTSSYAPNYHNLLPAFALPWEKTRAGKADAAFKAANPQWFEETVAPSGTFRGMKEWEPMSGMLITYDSGLVGDPTVSKTVVDTIVGALNGGKVWVLHDTANAKSTLTSKLTAAGVPAAFIGAGQQVEFIQLDLSAFWTIDFGPFPLINADNNVAFLDFRYYPSREEDDAVPSRLGELWGATVYRMPLDFEGGNFQADGEGTCYTTERQLENTGLSAQQLNDLLDQYASCQNLVVVRDIHNDGTGHIDMFFKLIDKSAAILGSFTAAQDPTAKADMDYNETLLKGVAIPGGGTMTVYRMPHPNAWEDPTYGTTPRTYLNSTLFNEVNLWPMYTVDKDIEADALAVWQEALPSYQHIGIVSDDISTLSGAIHCITRTIPDLPLVRWVSNGTCGEAKTCTAPDGGYTGSCDADTDCHGPQWLCVVDGTCGQVVDTCQGVTYEGCCDGAVVKWCEEGALQEVDCATNPQSPGPQCGWDGEGGYYWCGASTAADPSGTFPRPCGECTPSCDGKTCGSDGCGGSCGSCPAGQSCQAGACAVCTANCTGKTCGDDGCGGTCGTCADGQLCSAQGQCTSDPCGGISFEGCCEGDTVKWCENGEIAEVPCPEAAQGGQADGPKCGWLASEGYYWCDNTGAAEPTGAFPQPCGPCTADCTGKVCGSDGCGGSCGTCGGGEACQAGACVACTPSCNGKVCGDDGCGGSCGECANGQFCVQGACSATACGDVTDVGCCDASGVLWYCENNTVKSIDCNQSPSCGWKADASFYDCGTDGAADPSGANPIACEGGCTPACAGKACGPDGCGGQCGVCAQGQTCEAGVCTGEPTCTNECAQGETGCLDSNTQKYTCAQGVDGCWDRVTVACGTNETCSNGQCVELTCSCAGRVCGDDGCGVSCGTCPDGQSCDGGLCKGATGDVLDDNAIGLDGTTDDDTDGKPVNRDGGGGSCAFAGVAATGSLAPALLGLASLLGLAIRRRRS